MEGRMNKYSQVSPERAKVWTAKSPKYNYNHHYNRQQNTGKVPVVYYLSRNRQLEPPHFMEVPLSSPDGLYLRGTTRFYFYIFNSHELICILWVLEILRFGLF